MTELLVAVLIIGLLIAVAVASFLGHQDKAHDSAAKQTVAVVGKALKTQWRSGDSDLAYPAIADLVAGIQDSEPQLTVHSYSDGPSTGPTDVSLTREDANMATACAKSQSEKVFCLRTDELGDMTVSEAAAALTGGDDGVAYAAGERRVTQTMVSAQTEPYARCALPVARGVTKDAACSLPGGPDYTGGAGGSGDDTPVPPTVSAPTEVTFTQQPPSNTAERTATFAWEADQPSVYECRIDGGQWEDCESPLTTDELDYDADHTFQVRASNINGSATSETITWHIDGMPTVTVTGVPSGNQPAGYISFTVGGGAGTVQCRVDSGAFGACTTENSHYVSVDHNANHTFTVRVQAPAGTAQATATWVNTSQYIQTGQWVTIPCYSIDPWTGACNPHTYWQDASYWSYSGYWRID